MDLEEKIIFGIILFIGLLPSVVFLFGMVGNSLFVSIMASTIFLVGGYVAVKTTLGSRK